MKLALSILLLTVSSMTLAGPYMGVSYGSINTDISDHTGTTFYAGFQVNDVLGIEGRTLIQSTEENYEGANLEIDNLYGIYVTAAIPFNDSTAAYIIAGQSEGEVTASYMGYSASADDSSTSIGAGLRLTLREAWTVKAEYMETFDDVDQFSVGIQRNF